MSGLPAAAGACPEYVRGATPGVCRCGVAKGAHRDASTPSRRGD